MSATLHLVRHGATEWSEAGRHTSRTDLPLLPSGVEMARSLARRLEGTTYDLVLTSPRQRARNTAMLAGFPDAVVDEDLVEWDYGDYEGVTTDVIRETDPEWTIWTGVTPGGESAEALTERLDRVVARVRATDGTALVFAHGHCLRALTARWLGLPVSEGRLWRLDTSTLSVLGAEREQPVILRWNS
ncbi:histidine phosphatase family protein [Nocardioides sp. Kera G14]|uniref:histidine phosphatase family protein n=1 Tax=Nocardioides sp. Kera G14 TaxID=2884264 RepID=UPI001D0F903C|nr:histidine phosphatase family protein [Nocardioides sp. Kera G14]UDY24555.1 histidine phosphatase family protein [Nocardioides sp. Kera G14]